MKTQNENVGIITALPVEKSKCLRIVVRSPSCPFSPKFRKNSDRKDRKDKGQLIHTP